MIVEKKITSGFTLIEMVLSVAMFSLILAMTLPMLRTFTVRNDLDVTTNSLVQNLRRAQTLARLADGDTSWGVHLSSGSILIFKGVSYISRDVTYDEATAISGSITISGVTDVVFQKVTGLPQTTGTTTFTSILNETRNVSINQKGMVDY